MLLTLYIEYFSQPSRAVLALCAQTGLSYVVKDTRLKKAQNRTEEFLAISPFGTVPAITHGELNLFESHAIMAYICNNFQVDDHWYPKNAVNRAKVDEYLHFHHSNVRDAFAGWIHNKVIGPAEYGLKFDQKFNDKCELKQQNSLIYLDRILENSFVAKSTEPSIADLACYSELAQYKMLDMHFREYQNVRKWMDRIEELKGVQVANKMLYKFLPVIVEKYKKFI